jgi:hypothetical protein
MCLDFPELTKDRSFKANLGLNFKKESEFSNLLQLAGLTKRGDFVKALSEMKIKEGEEEKPYFDKDFLISRYLGLTPDQIMENEGYKKREEKKEEKKEEGPSEAPEITL